MKQKIFSKNAPPPIGPYSQAIIANNMMFLSGQIAINPNTNLLVVDSIENETNMVLKNIQNILQENQCSMNEIIKCTIFLSDMNLFEKVNKVYEKYGNNLGAYSLSTAFSPPKGEKGCVTLLPLELKRYKGLFTSRLGEKVFLVYNTIVGSNLCRASHSRDFYFPFAAGISELSKLVDEVSPKNLYFTGPYAKLYLKKISSSTHIKKALFPNNQQSLL